MTTAELLRQLRKAEVLLHCTQAIKRLNAYEWLLHPSFFEFGRSGGQIDKLELLSTHQQKTGPNIHAQDFFLDRLAVDIALLRYRTCYLNTAGEPERFTNRSSLWQNDSGNWQLRFHQGTATGAFVVDKMMLGSED